MEVLVFLFIFFFSSPSDSIKLLTAGADTIIPGQTLPDNGETLVSSGKAFELGFFSPPNNNNRYLGIWFKNIPQHTLVWVANRDKPLTDSSGVLTFTPSGSIVICSNRSGTVIWSSNSSRTTAKNPALQLLNTGNLVLRDGNGGNSYLWQSFDHPCDTLIAGMKVGLNFQTGQEWILNSWKSIQDPSTGDYFYGVDARGLPQMVIRDSTDVTYRSAPFDGTGFGGVVLVKRGRNLTPIFVFNSTFVYYTFENSDVSGITRFVLHPSGSAAYYSWNRRHQRWVTTITVVLDLCDSYAKCGPNAICGPNYAPTCQCVKGFLPRHAQDWEAGDWAGGCGKSPALNCSQRMGFRRFSGMKLPDNSRLLKDGKRMGLEECKSACLRNCSCMAYAITDGSGCVVWYGDLVDIKDSDPYGQDLYIKVAASELESNNHSKRMAVIISISVLSGIALLVSISYYPTKKAFRKQRDLLSKQADDSTRHYVPTSAKKDLELPQFDLKTVENATCDFSLGNKIGEGGFGCVYKGLLPTGQEIAVKRLSRDSGQGLKEFKNEVILISKLQHRNLVRLLGCCIHKEERMLIYEYMPNGSLNLHIFDQAQSPKLKWNKRFEIIVGIARGLLYLHQDSRLRIIHRDLKASNVLLDGEMNPKISDFGLARTFGDEGSESSTRQVIGTYGYMAPEYAIDGLFSMKSDVFSFGVLVLEIVSGKKNRGFFHPTHDLNLVGYAWKMWTEAKPLEIIDPCMEISIATLESELLRCIQVGLLCVQERPEDRPTMSYTLMMLESESSKLLQPGKPGFYTKRFVSKKDLSSMEDASIASNEITTSMIWGR